MEVTASAAPTQFEKDDVGAKVFGKEVRDVTNDTWTVARDIGQVRLQHSRLNVLTSLTAGSDQQDHFKFRVASPGPLRLGGWNEETVRIQLLDDRGRVIADSSEDAGRRAKEAFARLTSDEGQEDFQPGQYIIRVSRLEGDDGMKEKPYALQLRMGEEIKHDYDTTEVAAKPAVTPVAGVTLPDDPLAGAQATPATLAAQAIGSMLEESNVHLSNVLSGAYGTLFPPIR